MRMTPPPPATALWMSWLLAASVPGLSSLMAPSASGTAATPERPSAPDAPPARTYVSPVTSVWRDTPLDAARARVDLLADVTEPSDLLLRQGVLYTVSDSFRRVYQIDLTGPGGAPRRVESTTPSGLPVQTDLEALAMLPSGEVLLASETNGDIFVLSPFPRHACAAWSTGIPGTCFFGRANCGLEALAVLPDGRLFAAKEREPREAYLFDLPPVACAAARLTGRTYLKLPEEAGPDISAATFDDVTGHLLVVARSSQKVLEFEVPPATPGDTTPRAMTLLGSFGYAATEESLGYGGLLRGQVEGIAVDSSRVLYLAVDNNERFSERLSSRRPPLIRFSPVD